MDIWQEYVHVPIDQNHADVLFCQGKTHEIMRLPFGVSPNLLPLQVLPQRMENYKPVAQQRWHDGLTAWVHLDVGILYMRLIMLERQDA